MQTIKKTITALFISSLVLLLFSACADMDSHSTISRFNKSENTYRASIRWGEWPGVFQLQKPVPWLNTEQAEIKPPSEEYSKHLETIKVVHIDVISSGMHQNEKTGESVLNIEYHFENSTKVHKLRHKVSWWHDKESNIWFTNSTLPEEFDLPKAKTRMKNTIKLSPLDN